MRRPRLLRWDVPEPATTHPYRDSAVLWAACAGIIVLVAWASGGPVGRAIVYAVVFFVVACAWSWWRWRARLRRRP
ncbi:MAG TPA: hypothetical protein VFA19_16175 [Gaiellaceae bacterium]|nr:hypothetical protein [Gaiellaceae bacterium]